MKTPSLAAWLERWLKSYAPLRCSPKTIERYSELSRYVVDGPTPELAGIAAAPLGQLRHVEIELALLSLLPGLSAHTIRHIAGMLSSAFRRASRLDLIAGNPMASVELPPCEPRDTRSLTPAELERLRDICRGEWTFTFVEVAMATGCRRGEMLALEWRDIDWRDRLVTISKSIEQTRAGLRVKRPKSGRVRIFHLPDVAIEALRSQRAFVHGRLVFPGDGDRPRRPDLVSQLIARRIHQAGIEGASLHSLRHTHATNLLSRGVPLPAISARLGHADPTITARIYCHALPVDDARAAQEWDKLLKHA